MTAAETEQTEKTTKDAKLDIVPPSESSSRLGILRKASEVSGRSKEAIFWEILRFTFGPSKLTDNDYFNFRLYDDKHYSPEQKKQVLGVRRNRALNTAINPKRGVLYILDEKLLMERVFKGFEIPGTNTIACFVSKDRFPSLGKMNLLRDRADLAGFLTTARYPIFGKPLSSTLSLGSAGLTGYDPSSEQISLSNGTSMSLDSLCEQILRNFYQVGFLFQEKINMHPDLRAYTGDAVGCFRVVTCKTPEGIVPLYAVWKIPGVGSMADNFWRDGKIALIDVETGQVVRCQMGTGLDAQEIDVIPETGLKIKGVKIPDWTSVTDLAVSAASLLSDLSIAGFDIVHSDTGPRVIEVNGNPNHGLYQFASGYGLLTPERQAIFDWNIAVTKKSAGDFKNQRRKYTRIARKALIKERLEGFKSDVASTDR